MDTLSADFPARAARALEDETLHAALAKLQRDFRADRAAMRGRLPEFDRLRDRAREVRQFALDNLDTLLERLEANVTAAGGKVHWCRDAKEARETVIAICREAGARTAAKSKSMLSEEIALNPFLEANGIEPVETDLGEYILQLRREAPSHIVMPAIHLNAGQIGDVFRAAHTDAPADRDLSDPDALLAEARARLRRKFLEADVGITGANALVAETGSILLVTNEGNADLVHSLPDVHIAVVGIEKVAPTLEAAMAVVRVLARSATTQEITSYTTFVTGPRRAGEETGPRAFHLVLVDNGRSRMLAGPYAEALRCIRCGACQSQCPVYGVIGGHAYGSVYAGPIGAVLTPALAGLPAAHHLPKASTFCGRCEEVCPVRIPLPALMRRWREDVHAARNIPDAGRYLIALWAWFAQRPALYRPALRVAVAVLHLLGGRRRAIRALPFAGGWTDSRDLPAPAGGTFVEQWRRRHPDSGE